MRRQPSDEPASWQLNCPVSISRDGQCVMLAHGEGGRLSRQLISSRIEKVLHNRYLSPLDDAAKLPPIDGPVSLTTDSFVVSPLFFPGGDIGSLAVLGTVNDLAVSGAIPCWLTLSLIVEEGLPLAVFDKILTSIAEAAEQTGTMIVAGDTKVVPRGAADGMFINTTGVGRLVEPVPPGPAALQEGDELVVSGPIGKHGIAVLATRERLVLDPLPQSDCASLLGPVEFLRKRYGNQLRCLRDATRGGVAAALHEWAQACSLTLSIEENLLPISPEVRGACELLGLDPLHMANEGTMIVAVEAGAGKAVAAALRTLPATSQASFIGRVQAVGIATVSVRRLLGSDQPLDDPLGAPLPRIC